MSPNTTNITNVIDFKDLQNELESIRSNMDQGFLALCSILIFMMQLGFALLEAGSVRSKNTTNILIKNLLECMIAGVAYWLFGYAFAFGEGDEFIGYTYFASSDLPPEKFSHFFFHYVFAAATASIVSGSLAERCSFIAYVSYSFILSAFIYPVLCHWAWSPQGWLFQGDGEASYQDFSGSGLIHVTGGLCGLIGAKLLGPRLGRFDAQTGKPNDLMGHSVPLTVTGGMILMFGFLPFNGGALGSISQPGDGITVSLILTNTMISAAFSGLSVLTLVRYGILGKPRVFSCLHSLNGALTGMVASCAGCNDIYPWGAAITGTIAGIMYLAFHILMLRLKIDDPLNAVAVHCGGGIWGVISYPFLSISNGIILEGSTTSVMMLGWNIAGLLTIICWTVVNSLLLFNTLKHFQLLRIETRIEMIGIDVLKHNEPAYPKESWEEDIDLYPTNHDHGEILKFIQSHKKRNNFNFISQSVTSL